MTDVRGGVDEMGRSGGREWRRRVRAGKGYTGVGGGGAFCKLDPQKNFGAFGAGAQF